MKYAILRVTKHSHAVSVRRSIGHAIRDRETPNADPERTPENTASFDSVSEAMARFNDRLNTQPKIRKNAVLAVEYLVTGSPEAIHGKTREEQDAYFQDALKWLEKRHGKENIVAWGVHRDETTPHMYAVVVPIDRGGKLNCRSFLGGHQKLSEMQTDFAENVGRNHGLERGIEGSKAKHTTISKYYARVNQVYRKAPVVELPEPKILEGKRDYGNRVLASTIEQLKPEILQGRVMAQEIELERARTAALEKQVVALNNLAKPLRRAYKALNELERIDFVKQIDAFSETVEKRNAQREQAALEQRIQKQRERDAAAKLEIERQQPKPKPKAQEQSRDNDHDFGM